MAKTGATRYQKFLKTEKAKTKFKSKKELPKGTNVTKTNYKVKKIVLKEQLKSHAENEALSTRKLNLKELLSRLNHFNVQSRMDALNGLKELVTAYPTTLEQNLGILIQGVIPLVLNVEKNVRRESLKVIQLVLTKVRIEKVDPFFDLLSTYLRSSMTHIDTRIQEDSLLFLDFLLPCVPRKMAEDFHKILPNFLDMISKLRLDYKPGRMLTVNLDSQITSLKWRVQVLYRLKNYLEAFVASNRIEGVDESAAKVTYLFNSKEKNYYYLNNPTYSSVCNLTCFSSKYSDEILVLDEVDKFNKYIETLIPLLFETWLEVCPSANSERNIETVITEDAALLLKQVLEVLSLLFHVVQHLDEKNPGSDIKKDFLKKYRQLFSQHFLNTFPYVTNIRTKQKNISSLSISDPKLVLENLQICHLFILFHPFFNLKHQTKEINSVLSYIEKTFNQSTIDDTNDTIIKILHTIFSDEITSWTKTSFVMDALFRKIIWAYFNKHDMHSSFKQKIFSLLCKVALNDSLSHFHSSDAYQMWLKNLPDILLEESVTVQTIDILHKFAIRSNEIFNIVVNPKLLKIIENLPKIVVTDSINDTNSYHKLFSLFYWIKLCDNEALNLLEQQLLDNVYGNEYGKFILDALRLRIVV